MPDRRHQVEFASSGRTATAVVGLHMVASVGRLGRVAGAFAAFLVVTSLFAETLPEIFKRLSPSVILVVPLDSQGEELGLGSGLVLTPDGFVATNYHVIETARRTLVRFPSGKRAEAVVVHYDSIRDLAILYVPERNLPAARLGNSDAVEVGETVVAIGNPQGLRNTLSQGIVSGVRQSRATGLRYIQTTVPLSPGSSGGPIINLKGEVIGLAVFSVEEGQNLNFAIPINDVRAALGRAKVELQSLVERLARQQAEEEAARRRAQEEEKRRKAAEAEAASTTVSEKLGHSEGTMPASWHGPHTRCP